MRKDAVGLFWQDEHHDKLVQEFEHLENDQQILTFEQLKQYHDCALIFDVETYINYFEIGFIVHGTKKTFYLENPIDKEILSYIMDNFLIVGFNSGHYDVPMCAISCVDQDTITLKMASDDLIEHGIPFWEVLRQFGLKQPNINHIDLLPVAPGQACLKLYAARIHAKTLQDLPFDPSSELTDEEKEVTKKYLYVDLENTCLLYDELRKQIKLRENLDSDIDLRSKSDAQAAEAILIKEFQKMKGHKPKKQFQSENTFRYKPPAYIKFKTKALKNLLNAVRNIDFYVDDYGKVEFPYQLKKSLIKFGHSEYRMGIGGLHSTEKAASHIAGDGYKISDFDVASYYPAIILTTGLFPKSFGEAFTVIFRRLVERRLKAKREGDKVTADSLKISINGTFGKLGSSFSTLYSPDLLIQTTLTGQLALLMLIEMFELAGIPAISANTDGVVVKYKDDQEQLVINAVKEWEKATNFDIEQTDYTHLCSRDVNNYFAVGTDGEVKLKGIFKEPNLQKNPANEICQEAVVNFVKDGTPIERTIADCTDIRKFVSVRTVKGGAVKNGVYLGKVIRWYYPINEFGQIQYRKSGNRVPNTVGAKPLMVLPDKLPSDINYHYYIKEAYKLLEQIGYVIQ